MLMKHEKVWIVGAQGQVGSAFAELLDRTEIDVLMTDIDDVDITNLEEVKVYAEMNRPDVIINCAGIRGIEFCEANKDLAYKVNALGARNLSVAARSVHAEMVQISTDDVFDGKAQEPYDEFSVATPSSIYGKSKLAGEEFVKSIASKYLIIRSSWVYGNGDNFVTDLLKKAKTQKQIQIACGQLASPTSAVEVAKTIYRLINSDAYGTYHAVCQGFCSRYEFARKIMELVHSDTEIVEKMVSDDKEISMRPSNAVLDNLMLRISGIELPKEWTEALKNYLCEQGYL